MGDWSKPVIGDSKTNIIAFLAALDDDSVRLNDSRATAATSLPDYAKRWNDTTKTFQNWLTSAWANLVVAVAGGGTGASTAAGARTNLEVYSKTEGDARYALAITATEGELSSDVTLTTAGTYYSGPSVSLAAGSYIITAVLVLKAAAGVNANFGGMLYAGATDFGYGQLTLQAGSYETRGNMVMTRKLTLGSTTTVTAKVSRSVVSTTAPVMMESGYGTILVAVKYA